MVSVVVVVLGLLLMTNMSRSMISLVVDNVCFAVDEWRRMSAYDEILRCECSDEVKGRGVMVFDWVRGWT